MNFRFLLCELKRIVYIPTLLKLELVVKREQRRGKTGGRKGEGKRAGFVYRVMRGKVEEWG